MEWLNNETGEVVRVVSEDNNGITLSNGNTVSQIVFRSIYERLGGKVSFTLSTKHRSGRWSRRTCIFTLDSNETVNGFMRSFTAVLKESLYDKYGEEFIEEFLIQNVHDLTGGTVIRSGNKIKRDTV